MWFKKVVLQIQIRNASYEMLKNETYKQTSKQQKKTSKNQKSK
jgi:hypothetical protein